MLFKFFNLFPTVNCDVAQFRQLRFKYYSTLPKQEILVYNPEKDKAQIFKETKNRTGIYQWTHLESGKIYIGSAIDLSKRLYCYYNKAYLKKYNSRIFNAILCHGYSGFSLTILECVDITNLSIEESKKAILEREQFYLDTLNPKYNILKVAGNSLGYNHLPETRIRISEALSGDKSPMFGTILSKETKLKRSEALTGKVMLESTKAKISKGHIGKILSKETKLKISEALIGKVVTEVTKVKLSESLTGQKHTEVRKLNMSKGLGTSINAYSSDGTTLINTFFFRKKSC